MCRLLMFYCFILLVVSCSNRNRVPAGIMGQQKMQAVLYDIMLTDALNGDKVVKDTALKLNDVNASLFQKVFDLHKISRQEFLKSYRYYLRHPDLLKTVTDSLSAVINRQNTELDKRDTMLNNPKRLKNGGNIQNAAGQVGDTK
jgi:hypothetical protein